MGGGGGSWGSGSGGLSTSSGGCWVSGITWSGGSWSNVRLKFSGVVGFAWTRQVLEYWGFGVLDFGWGFLGWRIYMRWDRLGGSIGAT